jgi:hypothetical protein
MAELLPSEWIVAVHDLAIGFELIDAGRGTRVAHPMRVVSAAEERKLPRPVVERQASCQHFLIYQKGVVAGQRIPFRFLEAPDKRLRRWKFGPRFQIESRRYVPRLISYLIQVDAEGSRSVHPRFRTRRPRFFPGAAYDVPSGATGLRGLLERGGNPARWHRVAASLSPGGTVIARAHTDDRGEFLLLLPTAANAGGELAPTISIQLAFSGPAALPAPSSPFVPKLDPYWDLPEEQAPVIDALSPNDAVSAGETPPLGFVSLATATTALGLGTVVSKPAFTTP